MGALVHRSILDMAQLVVRLEIPSDQLPPCATEDDQSCWRQACSGDDSWFRQNQGRSLRALLEFFRLHRDVLENTIFLKGQSIAPGETDHRLTQSVLQSVVEPNWTRLRLAVLQAVQKDEADPVVSLLMQSLLLDVDQLMILRDTIAFCLATDDATVAQVVAQEPEGWLAAGIEQRDERISESHRTTLREDSAVRQALERLKFDADACLAVETAWEYGARCRDDGDDRTESLVNLIAQLLATEGPPTQGVPDLQLDQLRQTLARGDDGLLSKVADARMFALQLIGMIYTPPENEVAAKWVASVKDHYWSPFRDAILPPGPFWLENALRLLTVVESLLGPSLPTVSNLDEFIDFLQPEGDGHWDVLEDAVMALDADRFLQHCALDAQHARSASSAQRRLTYRFLTRPMRLEGLCRLSGVDDLYDHLVQTWELVDPLPSDTAGKALRSLIITAVQNRPDDRHWLARELGQLVGSEPSAREEVLRRFVEGEFGGADASGMLQIFRAHESELRTLVPDFTSLMKELLEATYHEMRGELEPEAADNPHLALNVVWRLLSGEMSEYDVQSQYENIGPLELECLQEAFHRGDGQALQANLPVRVIKPSRRPRPSRLTPLRVYGGLMALMLVGYLALHVWVVMYHATPEQAFLVPAADENLEKVQNIAGQGHYFRAHDESMDSVPWLSEKAQKLSNGQVRWLFDPVACRAYDRFMTLPTKDAMRYDQWKTTRSGLTPSVQDATYGEACEYCRRLTDHLRAVFPLMFSTELKGYECRLPRRAEAMLSPLQLSSSAVSAEWLCPEEPEDRTYPSWPVQYIGGEGIRHGGKYLPEDATVFRVVLAPRESD